MPLAIQSNSGCVAKSKQLLAKKGISVLNGQWRRNGQPLDPVTGD